jgi:hypothetical protein
MNFKGVRKYRTHNSTKLISLWISLYKFSWSDSFFMWFLRWEMYSSFLSQRWGHINDNNDEGWVIMMGLSFLYSNTCFSSLWVKYSLMSDDDPSNIFQPIWLMSKTTKPSPFIKSVVFVLYGLKTCVWELVIFLFYLLMMMMMMIRFTFQFEEKFFDKTAGV